MTTFTTAQFEAAVAARVKPGPRAARAIAVAAPAAPAAPSRPPQEPRESRYRREYPAANAPAVSVLAGRFPKGMVVQLSERGLEARLYARLGQRRGHVVGWTRNGQSVRVLWDGVINADAIAVRYLTAYDQKTFAAAAPQPAGAVLKSAGGELLDAGIEPSADLADLVRKAIAAVRGANFTGRTLARALRTTVRGELAYRTDSPTAGLSFPELADRVDRVLSTMAEATPPPIVRTSRRGSVMIYRAAKDAPAGKNPRCPRGPRESRGTQQASPPGAAPGEASVTTDPQSEEVDSSEDAAPTPAADRPPVKFRKAASVETAEIRRLLKHRAQRLEAEAAEAAHSSAVAPRSYETTRRGGRADVLPINPMRLTAAGDAEVRA